MSPACSRPQALAPWSADLALGVLGAWMSIRALDAGVFLVDGPQLWLIGAGALLLIGASIPAVIVPLRKTLSDTTRPRS